MGMPLHILVAVQRCPACGYSFAWTLWCHDGRHCPQSPEVFLDSLTRPAAAHQMPLYAVRTDEPGHVYPDSQVRVWPAGCLDPVFTGNADEAVPFMYNHACPAVN